MNETTAAGGSVQDSTMHTRRRIIGEALYPRACLLNHACAPNANRSPQRDFELPSGCPGCHTSHLWVSWMPSPPLNNHRWMPRLPL